jgi:hypothetical protein
MSMTDCATKPKWENDCPVKAETRKIKNLGKEMLKSMRRLRISLQACEHCEIYEECTFRQEFNSTINQVVDEIVEGWNVHGRTPPTPLE